MSDFCKQTTIKMLSCFTSAGQFDLGSANSHQTQFPVKWKGYSKFLYHHQICSIALKQKFLNLRLAVKTNEKLHVLTSNPVVSKNGNLRHTLQKSFVKPDKYSSGSFKLCLYCIFNAQLCLYKICDGNEGSIQNDPGKSCLEKCAFLMIMFYLGCPNTPHKNRNGNCGCFSFNTRWKNAARTRISPSLSKVNIFTENTWNGLQYSNPKRD